MATKRRSRRRRRPDPERDVKDRLVQTRVPERLENVLKEEARKQRLTVSHLIRNMLEDTLQLVDTVVVGASDLVGTSVGLAEQVARDAGKIASTARDAVRSRSPTTSQHRAEEPAPQASVNLDHVLGWNEVIVHRPASCSACGALLARGVSAHLGVAENRDQPPAWLCAVCVKRL